MEGPTDVIRAILQVQHQEFEQTVSTVPTGTHSHYQDSARERGVGAFEKQSGLRGTVRAAPNHPYQTLVSQNVEEGLRVSFQLAISDSRKQTTYFAFCYPYSYSECQRRLTRLDEQFRQPSTPEAADSIYYHRYVSECGDCGARGMRADSLQRAGVSFLGGTTD